MAREQEDAMLVHDRTGAVGTAPFGQESNGLVRSRTDSAGGSEVVGIQGVARATCTARSFIGAGRNTAGSRRSCKAEVVPNAAATPRESKGMIHEAHLPWLLRNASSSPRIRWAVSQRMHAGSTWELRGLDTAIQAIAWLSSVRRLLLDEHDVPAMTTKPVR